MSSGVRSSHRDVSRTASGAGPGISPSRLCMGCNVARQQSGGIGQGVRWRCAVCVAFRAAPIVDGGLFHLEPVLRPLFLKTGIALADRSDAAFADAQNALKDAIDASLDYQRGPGA